jgi:glycosyltransferase involved in cell wall biosynthesis
MKTILIMGSKEYPPNSGSKDDPLPSGGMEVYTDTLLRSLKNYSNIKIRIITRKFRKTKKYEQNKNIEIYRVPWINGFFLRNPSFNLASFFKSLGLKHDFILTNGVFASFFGFLTSKLKRSKIIMRPAGIACFQPQYNLLVRKTLFLLEKFTYNNADILVFLSEQEKRNFEKKLGYLPSCYRLVPTGINIKKFNLSKNKTLAKTLHLNDKTVISSVGRLIKVKGLQYLIEAISLLKNKNIKCLIIGDGPEKNSLQKLVKELSLENKVIFLGKRKDIPELLSATDIFVLPSLSEGLPISLLEAMASKCACVVTDIGLPVEDKKTGIVVPVKNPKRIAKAIDYLLINSKKSRIFGKNSLALVKSDYSLEKMSKSYLDIFNNLGG